MLELLQRNFGFAWAAGIVMAVAMVVFAAILELPVWDPDSIVPGYIRMPAIVALAILADVVPRVLWRSRRGVRAVHRTWLAVWRERWPTSHLLFAIGGVSAWYLCYATFRNLKSMAPFVNDRNWDAEMARLDRVLFFDHDPAQVTARPLRHRRRRARVQHRLHGVDRAGPGEHRDRPGLDPPHERRLLVRHRGRLRLDARRAVLHPVAVGRSDLQRAARSSSDLPDTLVTRLAADMWDTRLAVLDDRFAAGTLQTIAAFPSLHVGIMVTICLIVEYVGLARWIRLAAWAFLVVTILATVYLGWHFFIDTIAGAAVGSVTVWAAALATGNHDGLRPRLRRTPVRCPDRGTREGPRTQGRSTRLDR